MNEWKKFFGLLLGFMAAIGLVLASVAEFLLGRINEDMTGTMAAVGAQLEDGALYGSALTGDVRFLKYAMAARLKPDIIAIGASRTLQFRQGFFTGATFYTMGGIGDSIDGLAMVFHEVTKHYTPKIVILDVDWDWLNPHYAHGEDASPLTDGIWPSRRLYLYKRLWQELNGNPKVRAQMLRPDFARFDWISRRPAVGLMAAADHRGFRPDGSFQYGEGILHLPPTAERLAEAHRFIAQGYNRFAPADSLDDGACQKLRELLREMKREGCYVIVFLPPFAHGIYEAMLASAGHRDFLLGFEQAVKDMCAAEGIACYDFSDMEWLGSSDEEALDGLHGSERTYGRLMLRLQDDARLAPYIDAACIERALRESDSPIHILPADS